MNESKVNSFVLWLWISTMVVLCQTAEPRPLKRCEVLADDDLPEEQVLPSPPCEGPRLVTAFTIGCGHDTLRSNHNMFCKIYNAE